MTRLETPIKDILGTKYYTYQLIATNYNPALNGTITIVCAVSNDYNAEQPSSVILYQNDVEIGSGTLQTSGRFKDHYTWTITCDTPGLQIFRVKDASIEVYVENKVTAIGSSSTHAQYPSAKAVYDYAEPKIEDTGWKDVTYSSGYSAYSSGEAVRYRRIGKVVHLEGAFKNTNALTSSNTDVKFASISDSTCRPSQTQVTLQQGSGANKFVLIIATNGDLKWSRYGTTVTNTSISSASWFNCVATWFVD